MVWIQVSSELSFRLRVLALRRLAGRGERNAGSKRLDEEVQTLGRLMIEAGCVCLEEVGEMRSEGGDFDATWTTAESAGTETPAAAGGGGGQ